MVLAPKYLSDKGSVHKYIRYRRTEQFDENAFLSDLAQPYGSNINSYEDPSAAVNFSMKLVSLYLTNMIHSKRNESKSVSNLAGWIRKFLIPSKLETNFTMKTIWITGAISDKKEVISGVPKWSVLGSILFLIYVNDLPLSLASTCADIFADYTTIGTSNHSLDTWVDILTTDLQDVLSWCNSKNMSLNVSKTKLIYISYRHKQQILAICDHDISICDSEIQVSSVEILLGVTISNTLCWDAHIDDLIKKCNSYLFLLSRIKVFLSRRNRILFYNSYILPHLDFMLYYLG